MRPQDYEILFDLPSGVYDGHAVDGVRTATWRAGDMLEIACYPITRISTEAKREMKRRKTSPAMMKINARNQERHTMRLIEANFSTEACVVTGTYRYPDNGDYGMCDLKELAGIYHDRALPWEMERVRMDVRNWLAKLRRRVVKLGGTNRDFRWIVRIEEGKEPPAPGIPAKFHFHAIVEGPGLDSETVKAIWEEKHGWARVDGLSKKDGKTAGLANYFCKQRSGGRWMSHSRNLKIVLPTISDRKMSRRRLARVAADIMRDGKAILEKLYPGYKLAEEPIVHYSDFVAGAYVYARMRRRN